MSEQRIKCWQPYYDQIVNGELTFQIRNNDRNYQSGDVLLLEEYDPTTSSYTGRHYHVVINRVFKGLPGLEPGYIAFTHLPVVER